MELIAATLAVAALVWAVVLFRQGGLLAGTLAMLVAGICFGSPFFSIPGGPAPITIDRVLLVGIVGLYATGRYVGWIKAKPFAAADLVLLAFIGVLTFSVFSHDWKANRSQSLSYLIFLWLMPLAVYWVARHMTLTERGVRWMFGVFAVLGVYLAFTSVCEMKYQWEFVFPKYIVSTKFKEFLGRGRGPLLNPAGNGILMGICLACGLMFWPQLNKWARIAMATVYVPLMMAGIYATLTRSAWMGGCLGLFVMVLICLPRRWQITTLAGVLIASTLFVAAKWDSLLAFKRDKELSAAEVADSASLRPILAYIAWNMFWDRPLAGCGLGHCLDEQKFYLSDRGIDLPLEKVRPYVQHNAVLSLLVETGLMGAGTFLVLIGVWLREAWRLWKRCDLALWQRQLGLLLITAIAGYFPNAMFQDTTIIPMISMLIFFLAGIMLNMLQEPLPRTWLATTSSQLRDQRVEREWRGADAETERVKV